MSRLITNAIRSTSASADAITMDGSGNATFPANVTCSVTATGFGGGKLLQVVQTVKTDTFSSTSGTFTDITGMSVTITPSSSSNKIRIKSSINYGGDDNFYGGIALLRGSTSIGVSTAGTGNQINATIGVYQPPVAGNGQYKAYNASIDFLDSPNTTSATTYKLMVYCFDSMEFNLNKPHSNNNLTYIVCGISTITAEEIAA